MPGNLNGKIFEIKKFLQKFFMTIITIKPLKFFAIVFFSISNIRKKTKIAVAAFQLTFRKYNWK